MARNVANFGYVRRFGRHIRVEPEGHRSVDDGLALLFQQGDEPFFCTDVAVDEVVGVVEVAHDGGLFFQWGNWQDLL